MEQPTPQQMLSDVADQVDAQVTSGVLNNGQGHALTTRLDHAVKKLDQGKTKPAANEIQAFINQVEGLVHGHKFTEAESQALIDAANAALAGI